MYPQTKNSKRFLGYSVVFCLILSVAFGIYLVLSAVIIRQTTGILKVSSSSKGATLSVSQENHQAAFLGTGSAVAHLKPGDYRVVASDGGSRATAVVIVTRQQTTVSQLKLTSKTIVPSLENITFRNTGSLIDGGMSTTQVAIFKHAVFEYSQAAKSVDIDPASVTIGPFDRNSAGPYTLNFKLTIDSTPYTASLVYTSPDTGNILLFRTSDGAQVYSGAQTDD